ARVGYQRRCGARRGRYAPSCAPMRAALAAPTVLALVAVPLGAGSDDAIAATVARSGDALASTAAPGERNRLTIARGAAATVVFHDDGAPVSGCAVLDAQTVRCAAAGATVVDLGDGDETLTVSGPGPVTAA